MFSLDHLSSTKFEEFCFDLLVAIGCKNVSWRKGTGLASSPSDRGRDIECDWLVTEPDGSEYAEHWFVECKHYRQGVPPEKIQGALSWATAERPAKLVLIASNFFSNGTKECIDAYRRNQHPAFRVKLWERPDLERMTAGKTPLLRKYHISGQFPFVVIMHPAHLMFLREAILVDLHQLFDLLDKWADADRDAVLQWVYLMIIRPRQRRPVTGEETLRELLIDEVSYAALKQRCQHIVESGAVDQAVLGYFITTYTLQNVILLGDTTGVGDVIVRQQHVMDHLEQQRARAGAAVAELDAMLAFVQDSMQQTPERAQRYYVLYERFCETVIAPLLIEESVT